MSCTDPYSEQCHLLKRRLSAAEKTIENKNGLIEMLRDQLKLMEERQKETLDVKEQFRYKYCSVKQGYEKSNKICQKLEEHNRILFQGSKSSFACQEHSRFNCDRGVNCSSSNLTFDEDSKCPKSEEIEFIKIPLTILSESSSECKTDTKCSTKTDTHEKNLHCNDCGLNRNKILKIEDIINEYTDVIGKLDFEIKFLDLSKENAGDCGCQQEIQKIQETVNSILKDKDFYKKEIINLSALFKNRTLKEKDCLIEKLQKECQELNKTITNLEIEKIESQQKTNTETIICMTELKETREQDTQTDKAPFDRTNRGTITHLRICTDEDTQATLPDVELESSLERTSFELQNSIKDMENMKVEMMIMNESFDISQNALICECKKNKELVEKYEQEIENFKNALAENESKMEESQENVSADIILVKEQVKLSKEENDKLKNELQNKLKEIEQFKIKMSEYENKLEELKTKNNHLDKKLLDKNEICNKELKEIEKSKIKITEYEDDIEKLKIEISQLKTNNEQLEEYKTTKILLEKEIETLKESLNTTIKENERLQINYQEESDKNKELLLENEKSQYHFKEEVKLLNEKIKLNLENITELTKNYETSKSDLENELQSLEESLKIANIENQMLKHDLEENIQKNENICINDEKLHESLNTTIIENRMLTEKIHELESLMEQAQTCNKMLNSKCEQLQKENECLKEKNPTKDNNEQCELPSMECVKCINERDKLMENIQELQKQISLFEYLEDENENLKEKLNTSCNALDNLKKDHENLKSTMQKQQESLIENSTQSDGPTCDCQNKINELEKELESVSNLNDTNIKEYEETIKEYHECKKECQEMADSVIKMQTILENLMKEKENLEAEVQDLHLQADTYRMISKKLEDEKCELMDAIEDMETQVCAENDILMKKQAKELEEMTEKFTALKSVSEIQENVLKTTLMEKDEEFNNKMMSVNKLIDDVCNVCPELQEIIQRETRSKKSQNSDVYECIEQKLNIVKKHLIEICQELADVKQSLNEMMAKIQESLEKSCDQKNENSENIEKCLETIITKLDNDKSKCACSNKPCECVDFIKSICSPKVKANIAVQGSIPEKISKIVATKPEEVPKRLKEIKMSHESIEVDCVNLGCGVHDFIRSRSSILNSEIESITRLLQNSKDKTPSLVLKQTEALSNFKCDENCIKFRKSRSPKIQHTEKICKTPCSDDSVQELTVVELKQYKKRDVSKGLRCGLQDCLKNSVFEDENLKSIDKKENFKSKNTESKKLRRTITNKNKTENDQETNRKRSKTPKNIQKTSKIPKSIPKDSEKDVPEKQSVSKSPKKKSKIPKRTSTYKNPAHPHFLVTG